MSFGFGFISAFAYKIRQTVAALALGPEMVIGDTTFSTTTGWTIGTGWSIAAGVATTTGAIGTFYTSITSVTAGDVLHLTFDVTEYTSGNLYVRVGDNSNYELITITGVGTYERTFPVVVQAYHFLYFNNTADFIGSIDNVSVKKVL